MYAFVTRHLGFSPLSSLAKSAASDDASIARTLIGELLPFLTDRQSRLVFSNTAEVVTDMYGRLVSSDKVLPFVKPLPKDFRTLFLGLCPVCLIGSFMPATSVLISLCP